MDTPANHTEQQKPEELQQITPDYSLLNRGRFSSDTISIERRSASNTVFHVDDTPFQSTTPAATHWSVAWSDLMMTMFILFLSMFVYQMAHDDFLEPTRKEIIGGDTTDALQSSDSSGASFPFAPISPSLPLMTAGTIKKVDRVPIQELKKEVLPPDLSAEIDEPIPEEEIKLNPEIPTTLTNSIAIIVEKDSDFPPPLSQQPLPIPSDTVLEPRPLIPEEPEVAAPSLRSDDIQDIYRLSKDALKNNDLEKFATIDLVPDTTMRIILTGDLLFSLGNSELSSSAKDSLYTLATVLKNTPYMINIVGHTDNIPMASSRYRSNWELSVSRASGVARFLIDEIGMNPTQFVVSGYASYRPVVPNNSADNRAKNRRVEIIISKRLPQPQPASLKSLN
ncbi:MAG: chemotaxis protein MotB [Desulforhopalus sp.]